MLFAAIFWLIAQSQDPNDYNPCGQYNSFMPSLCDYDRENSGTYLHGNLKVCHDCYLPDVLINDDTKFKANNSGAGHKNNKNTSEGVD